MPAGIFMAGHLRRYSLTIQRQPGANLTSIQVTVHGRAGVRVGRIGAPLATHFATVLSLQHDAHLNLTMREAGHPQTAPLPGSCPPTDPYIPYRYLHDPKHPV